MTHTIAATYSTRVTLGSISDNPTTITATGQLNAGLYMTYNGLTVVNAGHIAVGTTSFGTYGVYLTANGSFTNQSGGTVGGSWGIYAFDSAVTTVVNAGRIAGNGSSGGIGVVLRAGGSVSNQTGGTISGYYGIISNGPLTVVNAGDIAGGTGRYSAGVWLSSESSVTNQDGGTISGAAGMANNSPVAGGRFVRPPHPSAPANSANNRKSSGRSSRRDTVGQGMPGRHKPAARCRRADPARMHGPCQAPERQTPTKASLSLQIPQCKSNEMPGSRAFMVGSGPKIMLHRSIGVMR
jgi:hypothetical protein